MRIRRHGNGSAIHVVPTGDLHEHVTFGLTDGANCWCRPKIELAEGGEVVIHNAADGRDCDA